MDEGLVRAQLAHVLGRRKLPACGRRQTDQTQGANPTIVRAAAPTSFWASLNSRSRRPTRRGELGKCTRHSKLAQPAHGARSHSLRLKKEQTRTQAHTEAKQLLRRVESLPIRSTFELPPVYLQTVSRTLELSLQSSLQLSLTVLVCYRSRGKYLALGGVYHPLWAALSSNPTPRKRPNAPRSETKPCPTGLAPSLGDGPGQGDLDIRAQGTNGSSYTPHCTLPK